MINNALMSRKDKLEKSRDLVVEMRPEFADALNKCLNFSSKLLLHNGFSQLKEEKQLI